MCGRELRHPERENPAGVCPNGLSPFTQIKLKDFPVSFLGISLWFVDFPDGRTMQPAAVWKWCPAQHGRSAVHSTLCLPGQADRQSGFFWGPVSACCFFLCVSFPPLCSFFSIPL